MERIRLPEMFKPPIETPPDPAAEPTDPLEPTEPTDIPAPPPRAFRLFYKVRPGETLERDITGSVEEALATACAMLSDGTAKFVNLVEVGRFDVVIPHSRIVHWCAEHAANDKK